MKMRLEKSLHLASAAVTLATAVGLNPLIAALLQASISVGLAIAARIPN
jgi:hypothetical protein